MAAAQVTFKATADGKPLEVLQDLVAKRASALRETTRDAVTATAINILNSLKSATKVAKVKPHRQSYWIEATNLFGGFEGHRKICVRIGSHYGTRSDIRPAIGFTPGGESVLRSRVYKIIAKNPRMTFARNRNFPNRYWYVLCEHEGQARAYAEGRMERMLRKERGMARYTIGIAQAKVSTRGSMTSRPSGAKSWQIAHRASQVKISGSGFNSGEFGIHFFDALDYSLDALKGGKSAFDLACMKAANKTAGLIHMAYVNRRFGEDCPTPYPEVRSRR